MKKVYIILFISIFTNLFCQNSDFQRAKEEFEKFIFNSDSTKIQKIKTQKFENMIAGATNSAILNKYINYIIENVDIVLSVGGAISDILDYIFDKSINNVIWKFKLW